MIACVQTPPPPPPPSFPREGAHLYTGYLALTRVSGKAIQEEEVAGEILYRKTLHHNYLKSSEDVPKISKILMKWVNVP